MVGGTKMALLNFKHDSPSMRVLHVFSDAREGAGIYGCLYIYVYMYICVEFQARSTKDAYPRPRRMMEREGGGWGRDPKKCTGRDWGMGSSTI